MDTKLYSEITKMKVNTPSKENAGKIKDILGNESENYWEVKEVEIKSGMIKRKKNYFEVDDLEGLGEEWIDLDRGLEDGSDSHSSSIEISLSKMKGKKVRTKNEEEIGTIYDFEVQVDSRPWKVWNILMKPSGMSPTKRRKRISIGEIESITHDGVILVEAYEKYEER